MNRMAFLFAWAAGAGVGFTLGLKAAERLARRGAGRANRELSDLQQQVWARHRSTVRAPGEPAPPRDEMEARQAAIEHALANARLYGGMGCPVEQHAWLSKAALLGEGASPFDVDSLVNFELEKEWRDGTIEKIKSGERAP